MFRLRRRRVFAPLAFAALAATAACPDDPSGTADAGGGGDQGVDDGGPQDGVLPDGGVDSGCHGSTPATLAACVDASRFAENLAFVAEPREAGSEHWQRVQDLCASTFEEHGFEVERHTYDTGVNVIGTRRGTRAPNEVVMIGAHYDSVRDCPGADDNASGTVGVLEAARVLAGGTFDRTLRVACWDEEEAGLIGSDAYAARLEDGDETVVGYLNFEMIGFRSDEPGSQTVPPGFALIYPTEVAALEAGGNRGDFIAFVFDEAMRPFAAAFTEGAAAENLPVLDLEVSSLLKNSDLFSDLRRSDHAPFWQRDIPAVMITDTANFRNGRYHCDSGVDDAPSIDVGFATDVVRATVFAAATLLK